MTVMTMLAALFALAAGFPVHPADHGASSQTPTTPTTPPPLQTRNDSTAVSAPYGSTYYYPDLRVGGPGYGASHHNYTCYAGPWRSFPPPAKWISFNYLWQFQVNNALRPIGDNEAEIQAIYNGIVQVSRDARVDARVILAVIIQESTGNVRVGCTNNGVENCGLMQSHDPLNKSYDPANYQDSITQMVCERILPGTCRALTFRLDPRRHARDEHGPRACPVHEQCAQHGRQDRRHIVVRTSRLQLRRSELEGLQRWHGRDRELCLGHCELPPGLAGMGKSEPGQMCMVEGALGSGGR